jgi:hypothetical protein
MDTLMAAADRFFRCYAKHCLDPDADALFAYLNALHSFNDKLNKLKKRNLFASTEFVALKALRNLFHHEAELLHEVRFILTGDLPPVSAELATACLIDRQLVERALEREKKDREQIASAFRWYGPIADIQPCVFNGAVDLYETVRSARLSPESDAFAMFDRSYRFETENGHAHRVTGAISCLAADVDEVLRQAFLTPRRGSARER